MDLKEKDDSRASIKVANSLSLRAVQSYSKILIASTPNLLYCASYAGLTLGLASTKDYGIGCTVPMNVNDLEFFACSRDTVKKLLNAYVSLEVAYNDKIRKEEKNETTPITK